MPKNAEYETKFWDILTRGRLVDLSQFHRPNVFDEVPLFTRYSDLDFLAGVEKNRANAVLLEFALKFLKAVISYEEHRSTYLAAITAWVSDPDDWIIPNLFFWSGNAGRLKSLKKNLIVERVTTRFGMKMKKLVSERISHSQFDVLEDRSTLPGETRAFVSFSRPPYPSFLTLEGLRTAEKIAI